MCNGSFDTKTKALGLSAAIRRLISSASLFSSRSLFTSEAPFSCAFPASASEEYSPTQGAGRGTTNSLYKEKKKWVQSKTQLLHPEGHLGTSTGVPHSYWSGCSGTVDALHDAGPQQTGTPRLCPTLAAELQKTETSTNHQGFFLMLKNLHRIAPGATENLQH